MSTTQTEIAPKLDPREQHFRIPSSQHGLSLFLRYLPPVRPVAPQGRTALYVHGGTFPSALSIAHRFGGVSWRDQLCNSGWHVWGLDFHGFGRLSDPYPEMQEPAEEAPPLGRAEDASRQLYQAILFITAHHGLTCLSLIAHSWGTIVACRLATRAPELIDRLVLFGPIARRSPGKTTLRLPAWRLISLQDQWDRFVADVPPGATPVLSRRHFDEWGERYLDADPESRTRSPAAVKVPSGAFQDIYDTWAGDFAYDPSRIRAPVAIIRGEWDSMCTDQDAAWLFDAFTQASIKRDIKIGCATHLVHLESGRYALYRETETFLAGSDMAPPA